MILSCLLFACSSIRNFVADHLKTRDEKDAALVAFVSPNEKQWRFSYVKMEYSAVESESGRVGVETHLTPARRFSYIVGEGESCHTAQTRFLALLQDTDNYPTLAQLEDAFSVEAVTKEFFNKYAELFGQVETALRKLADKDETIGDEFRKREVSTVDFAKKLMGQIVFLYFLQKKGWLGVAKGQDWGTGPHDFLRRLARGDYGRYENFFNDVLEPLFYDTLATDRGHEAWCNHFKCRIPFLNGGLFEPLANYDWRKADIILPNRLFTNSDRFDELITGTGILDVFDRYNFTVNEAEPLEKEVAIDPEMLGKVFENLIEENRRKGLGSFYTPREIVHYMCQESLISYLDTALNTSEESIVPSKPRQAKLFGEPEPEQTGLKTTVRREIVPRADIETFIHLGEQYLPYEAARQSGTIGRDYPAPPASIEQHARMIDDKLADITICDPAVGSGAFPVGMMIEIVRARSVLTPYFNDVNDRTSYHFKRHAIQNCLYGVDIDPGAVEIAKLRLWLSLVVDEEDVKQIKPLPNLDYKIVSGNSLLGVEKTLFNADLFKRLEELKPRYFDVTDQNQKGKFKHEIDALIHDLTNGKEAFDFEIYFSEVFHKKGGFDVVIANPPYVTFKGKQRVQIDAGLVALYERLYTESAEYKINSFALFIEKGLRLQSNVGVLSYIIPSTLLQNEYLKKIRRFILSQYSLDQIVSFGNRVFEAITDSIVIFVSMKSRPATASRTKVLRKTELVFRRTDPFATFDPTNWLRAQASVISIRASGAADSIFEKMAKRAKTLETYLEAKIGIKRADAPIRSHSGGLYKPFLLGRNMARYRITFPNSYILFDTTYFHTTVDEEIFLHSEKILVRKTGDSIVATLDTDQYYTDQTVYNLFSRYGNELDLYAVLGQLNCKLLGFYFSRLCLTNPDIYPYIKGIHLKQLPVIFEGAKEISCLAKRILKAKRTDAEADTSGLEREIDELVYALYGLTPEEIKIVEQASAKG